MKFTGNHPKIANRPHEPKQPHRMAVTTLKRFFVLLGSVALLAGCNEKDYDPDAEPALSVSPNTRALTFSAEAQERYTFRVTTNQPLWLPYADQDWCKIEVDSEAGTFTVTALPHKQTTAPAPATITVTAGKAEPVLLTATQAAWSPPAPSLTIAPDLKQIEFTADALDEKYLFTVTTNQSEWTAVSDQQWCEVALDNEAGTFTVTALKNTATTPSPTATITVTAGEAAPLTITATQAAAPQFDIYLAGYYRTGNSNDIVCYWKNGVPTPLSDGTENAYCSSIVAEEDLIYIAGSKADKSGYWLDGTFNMAAGFNNENIQSIAVEDGKVYLLSNDKYWKDDLTTVKLSTHFTGKAIAVSGGAVQVAGQVYLSVAGYSAFLAYVWQDGGGAVQLKTPVTTYNSDALCATTSDGSYYFGGFYQNQQNVQYACYWKDRVCTTLRTPQGVDAEFAMTEAITVEKGTVYTAGFYFDGDDNPCYWVDDTCHKLELPANAANPVVTGITVADGKIYVAANYRNATDNLAYSGYWVDGKWTALKREAEYTDMYVRGIAVVERPKNNRP